MMPLRQWRRQMWLGWLGFVHSYPYRWAHKPLCEHFRPNVLRFGRVYICRSCTMAWCGIAVGVIVTFFFRSLLSVWGVPLLVGLGLPVVVVSWPDIYRKMNRRSRDLARFVMGVETALCPGVILFGHWLAGVIGAGALWTIWRIYFRKRRKRIAHACDDCCENVPGKVCSGFTMQADLARVYEAAASAYMVTSGYLPQAVRNEEKR